jgi:hypothetical protein
VLKVGRMTFSHPDIVPTVAPEQTESNDASNNMYNTGRIYPIYPELNGIAP